MRATLRTRRGVALLVASAALAAATFGGLGAAAAPREAADERAAASCAYVVRWKGRTYDGIHVEVSPRTGRRLGVGVSPPCNDTSGATAEPEPVRLRALPGVLPRDAVVPVGQSDAVLVRRSLRALPREVARLTRAPRCTSTGSVRLSGPWLGILGADGRSEVDLAPPYDLHVHVRRSSHRRYLRAFLRIRVPPELGRPLTRDDVESALWNPGEIVATVRCGKRGRYVATTVAAGPTG